MNRFGVMYSLAVVTLLAITACRGQIPTSTPCSLSFYRYLFNLPGEQIRPNVPEGTYVFGKRVGPPTPEGQASDARPTVVKPPYEAPLYLPPTTSTTTTSTTTLRPSTSAPEYIPPPPPSPYDFPADSSNSVSVSVVPAKPDCKHPEHQVNSELLPPYRVDVSPSKFQPPKFQAPKFEPQPFKFQPQPQLAKFQPPAFQPPAFQPPAYQPPAFQSLPQLPKFQPTVFQPLPKFQPSPAFQPQKPAFVVPQFVAPTIPAAVDDNNELTAGQQTQTVVVLQPQPQPRYPVPTPPPQFLRPYSAPTPAGHENCEKAHAVPSTTAASTTITTITTAAPEPPAETRHNEIFAFPEKAAHKDCTAHHRHEQPEESRGVPSTDYGVVVVGPQPTPSAGYSYDRPAAPLEYPTAAASAVGYAYPKASPSFDYPAAAGQFAGQATSLFESEAPGKSSAAGGAEDRGDLYILKV